MATNSAENQLSSSNSSNSSSTSSLSSAEISALAFGDRELVRRIKASNILLVGAGGIGCEVIKGLLLAGFERVTILDLDTIDVSNLNRQFLYNKSHVGESKAKVAAAVSVERFAHRDPRTGRPLSIVSPIHDSILSLEYNRQFYRRFTFVINALDNNTTRVHVNRLCLAADVPLIESASASYNGNVRLIRRGVTQCFECIPPRKDENTYASCTIRNTPSLPIHCVVWAKHLFAQLFGEPDEEDISPDVGDDEAMNFGAAKEEDSRSGVAAEAEDENNEDNNHHNDSTAKQATRSQSTRRYVESMNYDAKALFDKIFYKDILYLKKMENLWKNRREPRELAYDRVASGEDCFEEEDISTASTSAAAETVSNGGKMVEINKSNMATQNSNSVLRDQTLWTMSQCFGVFRSSLAELAARLREPINESSSSSSSSSAASSASSNRILEWDKDDDVAVDFVASVANFRSHCFYISRKSKFEIKSLAGNIIPAISSTNTIVGGYITLQAIRLLASLLPENIYRNPEDNQPDGENSTRAKIDAEKAEAEARAIRTNCFSAYITNKNYNRISKLTTEPLLPPVGDCLACSAEVKEIIVALPLRKITLGDFIDHVVKKKLRTIAPDINVFGLNKMLWTAEDDDDDEEESNSIRRKLLSDYAFMRDGVCLLLQDLEQNFEVRLSLRDMEFDPEDNDGEFFKILNQHELEGVIREAAEAKNGDTATTNENGDKVDLSAAVASTSSSSSSSAIETVVDIDDDEPECVYDQGDDQMVAPSVAAAAEPNDDDFEMIEMSELDEIEIEIETNMAAAAKKKRPKIDPDDDEVEDEDEEDDDLVCIEPKKAMMSGENEDQNGHSNHRRRNSNTPTNKRIRTN